MPRISKRKIRKPSKKQQQRQQLQHQRVQLQQRLLAVQLLVDDHVYKGRRIPAGDAARLAAELQVLRRSCATDVRLLQVADKLIRIMNTIIGEVESTQNFHTLTRIENSPASICGPLANENRVEGNINEIPPKDFVPKNKIINKTSEKAATDVTSTVTHETSTSRICRAISTLSIDENATKLKSTQDINTESQSILYNFEEKHSQVINPHNTATDKNNVRTYKYAQNYESIDDLTQIPPDQYTEPYTDVPKPTHRRVARKHKMANKSSTKATNKDTSSNKYVKNPRKRRAKNTEVDLSWVENIRFVRVVEPAEYTRESLTENQEDFWTSCDLPPYLDDSDFLFPY